jgi:Flp pilus assembly protein protease CpaA
MNFLRRFWAEHTTISNWVVLAFGFVLILIYSARGVGFEGGQWAAIIGATVGLAGLCAWIISWE